MARPRGIIDTRNPVEWKHPLNRGLVSWWLPFGPWRGGGTLRDLARRNDGTLTNFTLSSAWTAGRDGFGAVQLDGVNDHVVCNGPATVYPGEATFVATFRLTATPSTYDGFLISRDSSLVGMNFTGAGRLTVEWNGVPAEFDWGSAITLAVGPWITAVGVVRPNGLDLQTFGGTNAFASQSATNGSRTISQWVLGYDWAGPSRFSAAVIQSVQVYNRAFTEGERHAAADQTLRGYPDTLRRYSSAQWFVGTAGGGGGIEGTASGTVNVTCAASGSVGITGTGAGTVGVTVAASGAVAVSGTAGGTVGVTCSASGSPSVAGTGSGSVAVSVSAAGTVAVSGTGAGTVGVSAAASGSVAVSGTAAGTVGVTTTAAGTVAISGTASGTVNVTVFAQDSATTSGTAAGTVAVTCSASGSVSITGTGAGEVGFTVASTAAVGITGTAAGLVGITCAASDAVAPTGDTTIYVFTLF